MIYQTHWPTRASCSCTGDVLKAYEEPPHDWDDRTPWRLFNAASFALTGRVAENPTITRQLHEVMGCANG